MKKIETKIRWSLILAELTFLTFFIFYSFNTTESLVELLPRLLFVIVAYVAILFEELIPEKKVLNVGAKIWVFYQFLFIFLHPNSILFTVTTTIVFLICSFLGSYLLKNFFSSPKTMLEFNKKYDKYIIDGFTGLEFDDEEVVRYLDKIFERNFTRRKDFELIQVKSKFNWFCFYAEGITDEEQTIVEKEIKRIIDGKKD